MTPSVGWGVLHLFYRVDRDRAEREPEAGEAHRRRGRVARSRRPPGAVLRGARPQGRPRRDGARARPRPAPGVPAGAARRAARARRTRTCRSPSCRSTATTEDDERARLATEEGLPGAELEERARGVARAHGALPRAAHPPAAAREAGVCFYPMSKRRAADANWYELPFEERKELMAGHARVGRTYAGRVLQLITGSTGLDDWEWGVTLLADDPVALKEIVLRDALRSGVGPLRRVRPVLHRPGAARRPRRARASACTVGGTTVDMTASGRAPPVRVVPRGAGRPADDLRDREALRRRAEHPARQRRRRTRAG